MKKEKRIYCFHIYLLKYKLEKKLNILENNIYRCEIYIRYFSLIYFYPFYLFSSLI